MGTEALAGKPATQVFIAKQAETISWHWSAFAAIALASTGHLLIKFGLVASAHTAVGLSTLAKIGHYLLEPAVASGLAIYGVGTLFWISAVSRRDISFLYPITALNYVIVSLGGKYFFGETVSPARWAGIAVVVFGVALLQLSSKGERA